MIYIISPAQTITGGVEALHQLCYKLNLLGINACMYYSSEYTGNPLPDIYKKYNTLHLDSIIDSEEHTVIFPETIIDYMCNIKYARKIIWWLSVDFARYSEESSDMIKNDTSIFHFSQSKYSTDFLIQHFGIEKNRIFYVSDYLNSEFITDTKNTYSRDNIVLFNPKKGMEKTAYLIAISDYRVKWQALSGLTPSQMHETMQKAKVYIDFGFHPGKDRIPREAALSGCLILTNKKGAAANDVDIPIDNCYKYDNDDLDNAIIKITEMVENYDELYKDFENYREQTKCEFIKYETDVFNAFYNILNIKTTTASPEECLSSMQTCVNEGLNRKAFLQLVEYRYMGYPENEKFAILEGIIRYNLGEFDEAKFCVERALKKYPKNYELLITLVQILTEMDSQSDNIPSLLDNIIEYSKNTSDENECEEFVYNIKQLFLNH